MDSEIQGLDPEILSQMLSLGGLSDEEARLAEQMTGAKALQATPGAEGRMVSGIYVSANPLQHALTAMRGIQGRQQEADINRRRAQISEQRAGARASMLSAMPQGESDVYSILSAQDEPTATQKAEAMRVAIGKRRQLGTAGMLSGDPTIGKVGQGLVGEAQQGGEALGQAGQSRLKMAMAGQEAQRKAADDAADKAFRDRQQASLEKYRQGELGIARARLRSEQTRLGTGGPPGEESVITLKARAIMEGRQPPEMKGLFRMALPVAAELERNKFDLSKAQLQWEAQKRMVSSLNGPQQVRLRSATTVVKETLDKVEEYYNNWDRIGMGTQFPTLNRLDLDSAMQMGGVRGAAAQALDTLINDLILEQATVLQGGNAPTEESIKKAEHNLNAAWGNKTFKEALKIVKFNTNVRLNVMMGSTANSGMGADAGPNPYAKGAANPEPGAAPKATLRFNPATGKIEAIP